MRRKPRKFFSHQLRSLRLGQVLVRGAVGVPQLEHADEFRIRIGELRVRGVGRPARIGRPLARILDAEERREHQSSRAGSRGAARRPACAPASRPPAGATSAGRSAVSWRSLSTAPSSASCCQPSAIARGSGGSMNGKSSTRPRLERQHAQDHARQRRRAGFPDRCSAGATGNRLRNTGGSRCRRRCGRNGPCAGRRWPARSARCAGGRASAAANSA